MTAQTEHDTIDPGPVGTPLDSDGIVAVNCALDAAMAPLVGAANGHPQWPQVVEDAAYAVAEIVNRAIGPAARTEAAAPAPAPAADPANHYKVRVTPPATGPDSGDAGPTFHIDLPDGSLTVRRRVADDDLPEDAQERTDTVITIDGFHGPLEVITRTIGHRFG